MKARLIAGMTFLALACAAVLAAPAADPPKEALVDQVREAISRGVQYLRGTQVVTDDGKGHWDIDPIINRLKGGETSLAMLALLNAGVKPDDPVIQPGLKYLRSVEAGNDSFTYAVALQTMVYAAA